MLSEPSRSLEALVVPRCVPGTGLEVYVPIELHHLPSVEFRQESRPQATTRCLTQANKKPVDEVSRGRSDEGANEHPPGWQDAAWNRGFDHCLESSARWIVRAEPRNVLEVGKLAENVGMKSAAGSPVGAVEQIHPGPMRLSIIVPFHRNLSQLRQCLDAVRMAGRAISAPAELAEVIVVADGAVDDPRQLAQEFGARLLAIDGPRGPAVARNCGVDIASGDVVVFVDTDVVAGEQAFERMAAALAADPTASAVFGAYDEDPADPAFLSQCRNLGHCFIHQRSSREAVTFWAGLGAVRRDVFLAVGGYDERFRRPSVEDIDLGYRINQAGHRILLDPTIQGKHLKRWTFKSSIVMDVRDRGIPWTQLMHRYGGMRNDLNVTFAYRLCVVVAYVLVACLLLAWRWPWLLAGVPAALAALWLLDRPFYEFFARKRGLMFALGWFPFHALHHLTNGVSFLVGTTLWAGTRSGFTLPGALPATPWKPR